MGGTTNRWLCLALTAALTVGLAGCFPTRRDVYSDLYRSRLRSYNRWREGRQEEDALPRLSGGLNLEDAVKLGLVHSPTLREVLQEKEKARGQLWTAYGEALPTLDLTAGYTRLDKVFVVDLGTASFPVGDRDNWSYQVNVTQPLFKGGSIPAAVKGAKFFQFLSDERVRQAVQDVVFRVARAYYDVLLAERLYEVQEEALRFAEANLKDVTARERAGVAISFDRLRARVEVSNVQADMIRERNALNRAWTALFRAMGVSQKSQVALADELTYLPMEPDYEDAVRRAFLNRPELYQGELDMRVQQTALRVFYSDYLPELEAWGWHLWAKPDPHEQSNIEWDKQWQAGVRLTWTIFDGLKREGNLIQQRAAVNQSAIRLSDTEQLVLEEVRNGVLDLADADELVRSQQLNLERANEALRLVQVGAREGVNTELEVLDARSALTRTRGLYYQALHTHAVSRLGLQRALGLLGPGPGAEEVPERPPPLGVVDGFMAAAEGGEPGPEPRAEPQG
jgi:outer membrane protein TolC